MEADKTNQHDCHYTAQEDYNGKHLVLVLQILHHNPDVSLKVLSVSRIEGFVPEILFVNQMLGCQKTDRYSVDANSCVQE